MVEVKNTLSRVFSKSILFLLTIMIQTSSIRWCQRWMALLLLIVPITFFFLFGLMEDKMMPRGISLVIPTPLSVIPLYPSRVPLIDLKHFKYVINNDICAKEKVFAVVLIHTHPSKREVRDVMRRNIPHEDLLDVGLKRIFLMAKADWDDQELYPRTPQDTINEENVLHHDIVQGNFKEHYHNLTYKHVMGLQWVGKYCSQAKYVIKMDDDIAVDLFQYRNLLKTRYEQRTNLILGLLQVDAKPIRNKESKWYVGEKEFAGRIYPNFVSGWAYAIAAKSASKIVEAANRTPYFWVDDAHITGSLAESVGVPREGLNKFYTLHKEYLRCCLELPQHGDYFCDFFVGPVEKDNDLMANLLQHARNCYIQSCSRRPLELRLSKTCVTPVVHPLAPASGIGHGEVFKLM